MKRLSEAITDHRIWLDFLEYKLSDSFLSPSEEADLRKFVENREYADCVDAFISGSPFPYPTSSIISKQFSQKKRIVYRYPREENYFLKFIAFLLMRFDCIFSENLCSFRKNITVKTVIRRLAKLPGIANKYSYKADISDYFNSVDVSLLLPILKETLNNEPELYSFIRSLLENPYVIRDGIKISQKKGIMAGVPISSFLANLYLKSLDERFSEKGIVYIRYSDDIILFADSAEELSEYSAQLKSTLADFHLEINSSKETVTKPGETWEFLGFSYSDGKIDISSAALQKMKKKMKRKARALYRWKIKNQVSDERAVRAFIGSINRKLYDNPRNSETTWTRWYFPVINTDRSLHLLDSYMQDCIRFIASGNYSRSRYNFRYEKMKELGYLSLVNRYYRFKSCEFENTLY